MRRIVPLTFLAALAACQAPEPLKIMLVCKPAYSDTVVCGGVAASPDAVR